MLDGAAAAADNGGVAAAAPSLQAVGGVMAKEKRLFCEGVCVCTGQRLQCWLDMVP